MALDIYIDTGCSTVSARMAVCHLAYRHTVASAHGMRIVHCARRTADKLRVGYDRKPYPDGTQQSHQHAAYGHGDVVRNINGDYGVWSGQLCERPQHDATQHIHQLFYSGSNIGNGILNDFQHTEEAAFG